MSRNKNKDNRVFSSVSDVQLADIIAKDMKRNPQDFTNFSSASSIDSSAYFLFNTSARGIEPIKKWL